MENYRCKAKGNERWYVNMVLSLLKLFLHVGLLLFLDPYQTTASSGITVPVPFNLHPSRKRYSSDDNLHSKEEKFETMAEKVTKFTSKTARFIV